MNRLPEYLRPYVRAAQRHGSAFEALLWASPQTQAARFDAFIRLCPMNGCSLLDVGCGRADLYDHLLARGIRPREYTGIEAVTELADAARSIIRGGVRIIQADFVARPHSMFVGAEVVAISGALNTLGETDFHQTIRRAYDAAGRTLLFNFLSSPARAAGAHLAWRRSATVLAFVSGFAHHARVLEDYLDGDCTIALDKDGSAGSG